MAGLPLTWKTWKSQGIYLKSQGTFDRIPKVREFCRLKFIFSQGEDHILKFSGGAYPQIPPNGLGLTVELSLGLEKSGKSRGILYCMESGNPPMGSQGPTASVCQIVVLSKRRNLSYFSQSWNTWKVLWDQGHSKMWEIKTDLSCQVLEKSIYYLVFMILFDHFNLITFFE